MRVVYCFAPEGTTITLIQLPSGRIRLATPTRDDREGQPCTMVADDSEGRGRSALGSAAGWRDNVASGCLTCTRTAAGVVRQVHHERGGLPLAH